MDAPTELAALNGKQERLEDVLTGEPLTAGYRPSRAWGVLWNPNATPLLQVLSDIESMKATPRCNITMGYHKSAIADVEFEVKKASSPAVGDWALAELQKFWERCLDTVQHAWDWGWMGGEPIYEVCDGYLSIDRLDDFHAGDVTALTDDCDRFAGVRVKPVRGKGAVDLWAASPICPAKGFWYAHNRHWNRWYGRTQFYGAWRPWRRYAYPDGAEDMVGGAYYRLGYRGPMVRYPKGDEVRHGSGPNAVQFDRNRDKARQIAEWAKAGASFTMPSDWDPDAGQYKWTVDFPTQSFDGKNLIDWLDFLLRQIDAGIGVPTELIEAMSSGSGYSGRKIPMEAFLATQTRNARNVVRAWYDQLGAPLLRWNFGPEAYAYVTVKSLLEVQRKQAAAKPEEGGGGQPPAAPNGERREPSVLLSLGDEIGKQLLDTYGPYSVYQVDGAAVRNSSLVNQEFGLVAIHVDFPRLIPDREIWVEADVREDERPYLIENALYRLKAEADGLNPLQAYQKAVQHEAKLRSYGKPPKSDGKDAGRAWYRDPYLRIGDVTAWLIDARQVRDVFQDDFLEGANWAEASWIPKNEIWLEAGLAEAELPVILLHEYVEAYLMERRGLTYDQAHVLASKVEFEHRGKFTKAQALELTPEAALAIADAFAGKEAKELAIPFDESKHKRDKGKFATKEGAKETQKSGDETEADDPTEQEAQSLISRIAEFPRDALEAAWKSVTAKYGQFEEKFGRTAAMGMIGLLIAPGSFVTVPVAIALAGMYLQMKQRKREQLDEYPLGAIQWDAEPLYLAGHTHRQAEEPAVDRLIKEANRWYVRATAKFREALAGAMKQPAGPKQTEAIRAILQEHAPVMARALTNGRIAAILGGMLEVTKELPAEKDLSEERRRHIDAVTAQMQPLPAADQARYLESLSPEERVYAARLLAKPAGNGSVPALPAIPGEPEEPIRLPLLEEAARDLLGRRLLTRAEFDALAARERANAFTVAGLETTAAIARVQAAVSEAAAKGTTLADFIKGSGAEAFLSPAHAENVFRTNLQSGYTAGMERLLDHPLVGDLFPYATYDAIHDDRVREHHRELEGKGIDGTNVFRRDDPTWAKVQPPWDFNCRCAWTPTTVRKAAERGVSEAKRWLTSGQPPSQPAWVAPPAFLQTEGFRRAA